VALLPLRQYLKTLESELRYNQRAGFAHKVDLFKALGRMQMMRISSDRAQTTAEYSLILVLVVLAVIASAGILGGVINNFWHSFVAAWPA
jgi:Flp pilus assembly pilin Flp